MDGNPSANGKVGSLAQLASKASALLDRDIGSGGKAKSAAAKTKVALQQPVGMPPHAADQPVFDLPPLEALRPELAAVTEALGRVISGRDRETRLALTAWLAGGHVLIDGPPGLGKTTLARALSVLLGRDMQRVQFTSDLMPSDLLGASVYDKDKGQFVLHPGPIFTDIVLADEINRAPPRAQSALLEAMAEHRVSIDGETRALSPAFFVIATQNPFGQIGTFPLPESQLDRFLVRVEFGDLDRATEREILAAGDRSGSIVDLPDLSASLPRGGPQIDAIHVSATVLDYVQDLVETSRDPARAASGLSVRAGLGLIQAAKAWAWLHDRDAMEPEDVQAVFPALAEHRLAGTEGGASGHLRASGILHAVAVPDGRGDTVQRVNNSIIRCVITETGPVAAPYRTRRDVGPVRVGPVPAGHTPEFQRGVPHGVFLHIAAARRPPVSLVGAKTHPCPAFGLCASCGGQSGPLELSVGACTTGNGARGAGNRSWHDHPIRRQRAKLGQSAAPLAARHTQSG